MSPEQQQRIEAAICESEIAGSGHSGSEEWTDDRLTRACDWHTAEGNAHVRRFIDVLGRAGGTDG